MSTSILVFGAGSWGTALAIQLANNSHKVYLHAYRNEHNEQMIQTQSNEAYLPHTPFPETLHAVNNWQHYIDQCSDILIATPSKGFLQTLQQIKPFIQHQGIISATKGFCHQSHNLLDVLCNEALPQTPFGVLTGPSFAKEVAKQLPTAILAASQNAQYAKHIQTLFNSETFRCYTSLDVTGAEVGGAVKNVLAIACGISDGLQFGANARAGLITRGLKELIRFGVSLGGKSETLYGLSGLGDLILTCTDDQSRNRRFGVLLGQGYSKEEAIKAVKQVVEGIKTTNTVFSLAQKHGIDMPIVETIYKILYEGFPIKAAVMHLLNRDLKSEDAVN
ncbi:NAD(P)H-dependent glycerol-3-phosphate dehydrogenase [Facilibium subflavum]|uniref:NAD(P)H-dependent glycerol-3-phosphate dehydrogenase n=1 Tax=Facilibium subflavum TaxID=2219058 RepID=UPI000E64E0C7|nr:NAD(P)H-dependent glycerol-3-phosphate dehydrogenase [Facilibium subflavum]